MLGGVGGCNQRHSGAVETDQTASIVAMLCVELIHLSSCGGSMRRAAMNTRHETINASLVVALWYREGEGDIC